MTILTVGIDLAKNVFSIHGVNEAGKAELVRPAVVRDKLHELIASLPPCQIGMETCSGAHHWARLFQASGCRSTEASTVAVGGHLTLTPRPFHPKPQERRSTNQPGLSCARRLTSGGRAERCQLASGPVF